ncbi:MAG: Mut7-C RNAse domain-containing protein [Candidatus Latescibacterota bacterium]|jgi:hypothetical protein
MINKATFRFYEELNDFLPSEKKKIALIIEFTGNPSIKYFIESLGIPHTEVDLIIINGESVSFAYCVKDGDIISIYPEFESFDLSGVTRLRTTPLRKTKFIADTHLDKLTKYLRLLGFDCSYNKQYTDTEIIQTAEMEKRIILTKVVSLLKNSNISRGYRIRSHYPLEQVREVMRRFDLYTCIKPFPRCKVCNVILANGKIINDLEPALPKNCSEFCHCTSCKKILWKGFYTAKLLNLIQSILKKNTKERMNNQGQKKIFFKNGSK